MRTADFDFSLPPDLIAQHPTSIRDASRLLVLNCSTGTIEHRHFGDLPDYLRAGDVMVLNDSRVIPARLRAVNQKTGGSFEILLLERTAPNSWWAMMRPAKRARIGTELCVTDLAGKETAIQATVVDLNAEGHRRLQFSGEREISESLDQIGEVPLPPYIQRPPRNSSDEDRERYQTVYAHAAGSVAAPTAGLHFTKKLLHEVESKGVEVRRVTLHVGLGTFAPVKCDSVENHTMHFERFDVGADAADAINRAKAEHRRVIAVGTTTVRVLESIARETDGKISPGSGRTNIFIYPPYRFRIVDALVTNFHLPQSTLLMLVSAFAAPGETSGREMALRAYAEAVRERYRFFSYGDAMLIC